MAPLAETWSWNQFVTNQGNAESLPVPVVGTFGEQFLNIFNGTKYMFIFLVWILDHLWYLNHHVYYFMLQFIICNFFLIFRILGTNVSLEFLLLRTVGYLKCIHWKLNIVIVNLPVTPHIDTFLGYFKHHVRM